MTLPATTVPRKAEPSPYRPRRLADALSIITEALEREGWEPEPGSIDATGLTLVVAGKMWRLHFEDEDLLYPTEQAWYQLRPGGPQFPDYCHAAQEDLDDSRRLDARLAAEFGTKPPADTDWMSDTDMPF